MYVLVKGIVILQSSLFITPPDRINMVLYDKTVRYFSLDTAEKQDYVMTFPPDLKVDVPGGYGSYRVGSLGKLARLEKQPDILRKTFAVTTTTFIHYYFYPESDEVYYGDTSGEEYNRPSPGTILFAESNAGPLDRLYLAVQLLGSKKENFTAIQYLEEKNDVLGDVSFRDDTFIKHSIGLLYQNTYRDEQQSVQIRYGHSYRTADRLSALLEGNGIRVSDITYDEQKRSTCLVITEQISSQTARDIAAYFGCQIERGKTDVYDVVLVLGNLEREWEIR